MPTYKLRSTLTGTITESGVTIGSEAVAVPTDVVMTEAILIFANASGYTMGEEVTEATSGVTGHIYWNDGTRVGIIEASGVFTGGEVITGTTSSNTATPTSVENLLERTAATPRLSRILHQHALSGSPGSDQTVYIDRETKWFLIMGLVGGALTLNSATTSYPIIDVPEGSPVAWENDQKVNPLVIEFSDVATATLYELDIDSNPLTDNTLMLALAGGGGAGTASASMTTLEATPQDLTGSWADLGAEIPMAGFSRLGLYLTVDINDSVDVRVRALAKHTSAGAEEYPLPIETVSASDVKIEPKYIEFNTDADQLILLEIETNRIIPVCQIQIQAGTVGATAGQIDAAYITKG